MSSIPKRKREAAEQLQWKMLMWNSLTADAVHALTDLVSDIMTLATISWSIRPATSNFPMGYGKIESLGALAVSCILLGGGIGIGLQAVMALSQQFFPHIHEALSHLGFLAHSHSHGHDHGAVDLGPNINAAWLAAGSIVVKEWLYRATMKIAKEKRSSVLSSNVRSYYKTSPTVSNAPPGISPPCRQFDSFRSIIHNRREPLLGKRSLAGPSRRFSNCRHDRASWMGQHNVSSLRTRRSGSRRRDSRESRNNRSCRSAGLWC